MDLCKNPVSLEVELCAMKRVELKRIAEVLWKGNSPGEKTPFACRNTLPDNGSFSKDLESDDPKKPAKAIPEDGGDRLKGSMSITRKFCFLMSFNGWILYFLALGWLIPCRNLECGHAYPDVVETNLSSIWPLTKLETLNEKGLPSLAIIGYADGTKLKLAAFATFDATYLWNNTLPFIPKKVQCNFGNAFDVDGDGITDCLLSGFNDVYAFNPANGRVFWHQSIPSQEGNILTKFHPTVVRDNQSFLIGACGDKLVVLRAQNGTKVSEIDLPCQAPFEVRIVSNALNSSFTFWGLVCDYGDKIEAWGFGEEDVLSGGGISEDGAGPSEFALLFSGSNSGGSIDLGCDVTPVPGGPLLLSWADRVAMVTPEAIAWERLFPEPLTVASIKVGHFSNPREWQVAAAVHNATNTIVFVLDIKNGSIIDSVKLEDRQAQSMEMIVDDYDLLILKSMSFNYTSLPVYNFSDPVPPMEQTNFVLLDYSKGIFKIQDIVTTAATVTGSALNVQMNGETDLLIIKTENGNTSYQKHILHDIETQGSVVCIGNSKRHHYSFET